MISDSCTSLPFPTPEGEKWNSEELYIYMGNLVEDGAWYYSYDTDVFSLRYSEKLILGLTAS